jgi:hypothetical protein
MRMPLTRCFLAALCLAAPLDAAAPTEFGGSLNGYLDSSGVHVLTPSIHAGTDLDARTRLAVKSDLDAVSAASFNYAQSKTHRGARPIGTCWTCHPATDALSGATRSYLETRTGAEVSVQRVQGPWDLQAAYLGNRENDYASNGASLGLGWSSEDADTQLKLGGEALFDRIEPVSRAFSDGLTTLGADFSWTQVLSPRALGVLAWSVAQAQGYQANPYTFVQIGADDTAPTRVNQPREKLRQTGRLTLRQGLWTDAAAEGAVRYYQDDWSVRSFTYELSLAQRLGAWVLEPMARWQDQDQGAWFFQNRYQTAETYMTRDLKLAPHQSLSYGAALRAELGDWSVESRWTRYQRRDSLDYSLYYADGPTLADLFQVAVTLR